MCFLPQCSCASGLPGNSFKRCLAIEQHLGHTGGKCPCTGDWTALWWRAGEVAKSNSWAAHYPASSGSSELYFGVAKKQHAQTESSHWLRAALPGMLWCHPPLWYPPGHHPWARGLSHQDLPTGPAVLQPSPRTKQELLVALKCMVMLMD